jgi:hypothetical protein
MTFKELAKNLDGMSLNLLRLITKLVNQNT